MKVRATMLGFYNHRRKREGDAFTLKGVKDEKGKVTYPDFSKKWMVEVKPGEKLEKKEPAKAPKKETEKEVI